jgi:ATP-dependent helicase/nuclease subunit A
MVGKRMERGGMSVRDPVLAAADPQNSAWVSANAGAGKTHTLANRVTRLLLADAQPERILCLTYTKAAAAEMAGRLFDLLGKWAMAPDDELADYIVEIGGQPPKGKDDLGKARRLFAKALETPGGLKIQTIHAFCQNVLSRFSVEAGVPAGFTVIDEQTSREMIANARAKVLERAGSGDIALNAAVGLLVTETTERKLQDILDAALGNERRKLTRVLAGCDARDGSLTRAVRRFHGASPTANAHGVVSEFCASLKAEIEQIKSVIAWMNAGASTDRKRVAGLASAAERGLGADTFEHLREVFLKKTDGEPYAKLVTNGLRTKRPDLLVYLETLAERVCAAEERRRAAHAASLCDAALTIADAVRGIYTAEKRARGALDYDDLIAETLSLLERGETAAWVLYKLDGGLDHVLIDEAQDTSPEQWAILKKLTEEFFSGTGRKTDAPVRTVFAVGDEKQSIFSFQGADPAQFDVNRRHFEAHIVGAGLAFNYEMLKTSRRSVPEVLSFVDRVFADAQARAGLTSLDVEIRHEPLRKTARGRVEFWPSIKPDDKDEPDPWRPVDTPSQTSPVVRLAEKIAGTVRQWIADGVALPGRDHQIRPGDVMILLPRREPFGSEIIRQLKAVGVPVAGADRIRITDQIAVKDLIALARFALLPEDDLTLATILRSPFVGIGEEQLFALSAGRNGTLWRSLQNNDEPAFEAAREFLSDCLSRADFAPPYEFFAHVLTVRGMRVKLLSRLGAEAADAIEEFLSLALAYEAQNPPSLEGFLHWIERGGAQIKRDMERGRDEVRVMTVHGAKGLEADIVILPDTTRPAANAQKRQLLYADGGVLFAMPDPVAPLAVKAAKQTADAEALNEHRRLLYVALTRAKERLYICGYENRKGIDPNSWYALMERAAQELGVAVVRSGETVRVYGDAEDGAAKTAAGPDAAAIAVPDWARRPARAEREQPRIVRPSLVEPQAGALSPLSRQSRTMRRGLLIHALLARLPEIAPDARDEVARKFLHARGIAEEDAQALVTEILGVLDDRTFAPVFAKGSQAEVALAAELPAFGGIKVNGRVDRLAVSGDAVLVLDFKTDRTVPAAAADVSGGYLSQMALYREALKKVFGGKRIVSGLLWTAAPKLMRLPDGLLDARLVRLADLDPQGVRS